MRIRIASRCGAIVFAVSLSSTACDQISPSRYEITRDQSGRALRLDKRTGEISVIEGERVAPIRDAKSVDSEKSARLADLARAKPYNGVSMPGFGFEGTLRTSWQDGKLLYVVRFGAPDKSGVKRDATSDSPKDLLEKVSTKPTPINWTKFSTHSWTLILEDAPFELATENLRFIGVVDADGKVEYREAKGSIAMSSETYQRLDSWNVVWRPR